MRQFSMGADEKLDTLPIPNPMDSMAPRPIRLHESRHLRALGAGADAALTNPDDFFSLAQANAPLPPAGAGGRGGVAWELGEDGGPVSLRTGFEEEAQQVRVAVVTDPCVMHLERAAEWARRPYVDRTVAPIVTGGICIGIRCRDGVVLAADTMVMYGTMKKHHNARRLHKVTDRIVMAADGEYSDFQEMQTMLMDLVEDHMEIPPYGLNEIEPCQTFHFLSQVMYARRCKMDPLYNTVLVAGWGKNLDRDEGVPMHRHDEAPREPFLGMIDMHGTPFKDHVFATGIGNYMALPLLRLATDEVNQMRQNRSPKALTMEEARRAAVDTMRVLSLRCSQCSNRIQLASVSDEGVDITAPFYIDAKWNMDGFHKHQFGSNVQTHDFITY